MVTVGYPIWKIINNPNTRGAITAGNMNLCKAFLQEQKDVILSPMFRATFPEIPPQHSVNSPLTDWSKTQFTVHRTATTLKEPTVYLFTEKSKTEGWHFDWMIADDIVNRENYNSEVKRNHVKEFSDNFTNLVNDIDTPIIYPHTPWHPDDMYADLEKRDNTTLCKVPLYDNDGVVFFSEKFTPEYIKQKRDDLFREGGGDKMFTTQYLLEAVSEENAPLSKYEYIRYWEEEDDDGKVIRVTEDGQKFEADLLATMIALDTSGKGKDTCGIGAIQRDNDDVWFIRYAKEGNGWSPAVRFDEMIRLDKLFDARKLGVEVFGQISIKELLGEERIKESEVEHKFCELKHHSIGKDERIMMRIEPKLHDKKMFFHIGIPEPALKQIKYYREMSQDTIPDMIAYGIQMFEDNSIRPFCQGGKVRKGWRPHHRKLFKGGW
jgi:hypothetical protein